MESSFLKNVEREATQERDRVLKDLERLKFDAQQVIHVLNALNLEVPSELRNLSPIEKVPITSQVLEVDTKPTSITGGPPPTLEPDGSTSWPIEEREASKSKRKSPDFTARNARYKERAEKEYTQMRAEVYGLLSKRPRLTKEVVKEVNGSNHKVRNTMARMKKEGELDYRTLGFQGPQEAFLIERPVSLETLRDEVVKEKGDIPLEEVQRKLGFQKSKYLTRMMNELVEQGIIMRGTEEGGYKNFDPIRPSGAKYDVRTLDELNKKRNGKFGGAQVAGTGKDKISSNKEVRSLVEKARQQGAKVKISGGDHIQVVFNGKTISMAKTPSASGILQDKNRLKSIGLNV